MSEESLKHIVQERVGVSSRHLIVSPEAFQDSFEVGRVPTQPGCYVMQDSKGKAIYVGKAKNLRARIRSYLNESDTRYSVKFLMQRVANIEFLVTGNEKEALLLENSLIKQYKPRYNVQLRDDKTYLSVRFDPREPFPRLTTVRRPKRDGAKYFGPYHSSSALHQVIRQIHRLFPLRTCTDYVLNNRSRPCLYYQMKRCNAPCVGYCSKEEYAILAEQVVKVFEGRGTELESELKAAIAAHAEQLAFEKAAVLRDRLFALRGMFERQHTVAVKGVADRDVFGMYREGRYIEIQLIFYRGGKMLGSRSFSFERTEMPPEELLSSLLLQYYTGGQSIPGEVLLPVVLEDAETLAEILSEAQGGKVSVLCPQRGDKLSLVELAKKNAKLGFEEKRLAEKSRRDVLEQLQKSLDLPNIPERIECFDISTIQGAYTVGAMVCFVEGRPEKSRYRKYSIKSVEGQDDFGSMREVLLRRYKRGVTENDLPDLVLIDGGKGQLGVCHAVFKDLGIEDLPHVGLAKSRVEGEERSPERFFKPGRSNPIVLPQNGAVVRLVAEIRDEAHRFAITYHRKKRGKAGLRSQLLAVPGVGEARAKVLLGAFGSLARLRKASVEEIVAVQGISHAVAEQILECLNQEK